MEIQFGQFSDHMIVKDDLQDAYALLSAVLKA